jgi:uncharacterized damage-inducible protein DinB
MVFIHLYNTHTCSRWFAFADYTIKYLQGNDMANQIDDLVLKMENARSRLNKALDKISPQEELYPAWKIKQLLDHITGWDELVVAAFAAHARGEPPVKMEAKGIDDYNEKSVEAHSELSLENSHLAYDAARVEVFRVLREMPLEKLTQKSPAPWGGYCTVASILKILISHELEHARHVEEWLANSV